MRRSVHALRRHGIGHFDEAGNVGAINVIDKAAFALAVAYAVVVDVSHDHAQAGIDFVALSFVREAGDVATLRKFLDSLGSQAKIIAKIEDQAGVRNSR